uniref:Uncharacterized protein n=1 Tax=Glypta fumiferanae TaxID=389681 RepID=A0A0F6Q8W0_9HYME|nr:hypothetical protein [Glypta fumiferanae]
MILYSDMNSRTSRTYRKEARSWPYNPGITYSNYRAYFYRPKFPRHSDSSKIHCESLSLSLLDRSRKERGGWGGGGSILFIAEVVQRNVIFMNNISHTVLPSITIYSWLSDFRIVGSHRNSSIIYIPENVCICTKERWRLSDMP